LKKLTTKSGQTASIKIPKWKYADEMFVHPYLLERETVTNLEFDEKVKTNEEEMLQAEREHDGTAEQQFKNKIFQGTQKSPMYQPEMASAVLMKYLVESDQERQAEPPADPIDAFFNGKSKNVFSLSSTHLQVKNIFDCI
jgi:hypothetical protein